MKSFPLQGKRVLDLTRNVAGPYASLILANMGADVIKVEHPHGGDDTRQWGPPFWDGQAPMFLASTGTSARCRWTSASLRQARFWSAR